jgi:N-ethylmaleimide reductase
MGDSTPLDTFGYVARELGKRGIAFICAREALGDDRLGPQLKRIFGGVYIANEKMTKESAEHLLTSGDADAVAFGQWFIANPDLPERLKRNAPLNEARPDKFYAPTAEGYTDYPALQANG